MKKSAGNVLLLWCSRKQVCKYQDNFMIISWITQSYWGLCGCPLLLERFGLSAPGTPLLSQIWVGTHSSKKCQNGKNYSRQFGTTPLFKKGVPLRDSIFDDSADDPRKKNSKTLPRWEAFHDCRLFAKTAVILTPSEVMWHHIMSERGRGHPFTLPFSAI